jgi:hypothetical protein
MANPPRRAFTREGACPLYVVRCMLSVACCMSYVARCMLSVACCPLPSTCRPRTPHLRDGFRASAAHVRTHRSNAAIGWAAATARRPPHPAATLTIDPWRSQMRRDLICVEAQQWRPSSGSIVKAHATGGGGSRKRARRHGWKQTRMFGTAYSMAQHRALKSAPAMAD